MESDIRDVFMVCQTDLVLKSNFGNGQISYETSSSIVSTTHYPEISVQLLKSVSVLQATNRVIRLGGPQFLTLKSFYHT
jgi:hypothetical protein